MKPCLYLIHIFSLHSSDVKHFFLKSPVEVSRTSFTRVWWSIWMWMRRMTVILLFMSIWSKSKCFSDIKSKKNLETAKKCFDTHVINVWKRFIVPFFRIFSTLYCNTVTQRLGYFDGYMTYKSSPLTATVFKYTCCIVFILMSIAFFSFKTKETFLWVTKC